jgi:hypothetical protein
MKKMFKNLLIITALILTTNSLYAHEKSTHVEGELSLKVKHEHNHSCAAKIELSQKNIQRAARTRLWKLTQEKIIPSSWLEVPIVSSNKKVFTHNIEWIINYRNLNIKDKNRQNIYIFVSLYGHVLAASYTNK